MKSQSPLRENQSLTKDKTPVQSFLCSKLFSGCSSSEGVKGPWLAKTVRVLASTNITYLLYANSIIKFQSMLQIPA